MTPQASPNRSTLTWLIPITLLVAVCALVGGLIARQVYASTKPPAATTQPPAATSTPEPTTEQGQGGPDTVHFTLFARNDPQFRPVQNAIQNYFNAVNHRNYGLWKQTMTAKVSDQQTEQDWRDGYRTTVDTDMMIYRIETTDQGANVFGTFTSKQDPANAPKELRASCINWWMVWPMVKSGSDFRIDSPSITMKKCD
ncbi:hypothetical protein [Kutzneria kofuensis]|uniref:Uncharacterized protein n=1 Tax=Kutzneria kofuensis TaxID=103725 RepID=A0A7W9KDG8_9PSEU|nr:hypothetical protein [Kutzneria kofuensis]MBB5890546.1 hypothetical protein [Kutzneria kofuensis]